MWLLHILAAVAAFVSVCPVFASDFTGWAGHFYQGLEANGEMRLIENGYKGKSSCVELRYINGANKFGVEKTFSNKDEGATQWTVSAEIECEGGGEACVAVELFDSAGKPLEVKTGYAAKADVWTRREWKFDVPAKVAKVSVHLLSLSRRPVRFANVKVDSAKGKTIAASPLTAYSLPSAWNRAWNGNRERFTSFADAPLPMVFHFKGDRKSLRRPAFELEFSDKLELIDAFATHPMQSVAEKPVSDTPCVVDGAGCRLVRFEKLRAFGMLQKTYGYERKLAVVIAPRDAAAAAERTFKVRWRTMDGDVCCSEGSVDLRFMIMPQGLREPDFFVFSWQTNDRLFASDRALMMALKAYEAAGLTTFNRRNPKSSPRSAQIASVLEKRGSWRFVSTFCDSWDIQFLNSGSKEFKSLGVRMAEYYGGKKKRSKLLCPDYFNNDPAFHAYYRDYVILPQLKNQGVKAGDFVSGDLEPWGAQHFCVCEKCRKSFAEFKGLEKIPEPREIGKWKDDWAIFRCRQTEESVAKFARIIREYNPEIKVIDYDYVIWYGTQYEQPFIRGCAKNASMNEKWLDGHICSYYHTCDRAAFMAIRNNTKTLKKPYIPLGAVAGAGGYLRADEVRNPAQIRQLALAAAVHGCPGIGFYQGIHYDGEHLLALMQARDEIAAIQHFNWGKRSGALTAAAASKEFAYAAASSGTDEVIALFNYEKKDVLNIEVKHPDGGVFAARDPVTGKMISDKADLGAGFSVSVPPYGVKFVTMSRMLK